MAKVLGDFDLFELVIVRSNFVWIIRSLRDTYREAVLVGTD